MKIKFKAKYGKNKLSLILFDGTVITTEFNLKYGKNVVRFATTDRLKTEFYLKYGENEIEIPVTDDTKAYRVGHGKLVNLWGDKVTIYNDISETASEQRHFDRFVIDKCSIQGGRVSKADGTVENIVNAQTVWTKDVTHYKDPREYARLPNNMREDFFTVQVGDFVVLGETDYVVENAADFATLQKIYSDNGFKITSVSPNINGMTVDNVSFTNA